MYHPIDSYALIGNMRSAALVGPHGSIDWLCLPRFDSPSVFGGLLDYRTGGCFKIYPRAEHFHLDRYYLPDTNVLISRYRQGESIAEVVDFMPVPARPDRPVLVRLLRAVYGELCFRAECRPAFNYARAIPKVTFEDTTTRFQHGDSELMISSSGPLHPLDDGVGVYAERTVRGGESRWMLLGWSDEGPQPPLRSDRGFVERLYDDTVAYWRRWIGQCKYHGHWEERVHRSALALKLLTYEPTGAIVAAPTTSLPEHIGGSRNWDYRYTWLRDAAFTVYAFLRIGFNQEAAAFMHWLQQRSHELEPSGMFRPLYRVDGGHDIEEEELPHLEGYRASRPVRIGNAAAAQLQLDVPGAVMDAAYLHNKYATPLSYDMWLELEKLLNWTSDHWSLPDEGVWEIRGGRQHFTFSKLMCWVALDRGLRLATSRSFPGEHQQWIAIRDRIYREIMQKAWNPELRAFTQAYGTANLDASVLIMPLVFFIAPNDPRFLETIEAIRRPLSAGGLVNDLLVHRYNEMRTNDGLDQPEGGFNMCTWWLVEVLTRARHAGREYLEAAQVMFDRLVASANEFGLYAEQSSDGYEALGNYPQAFTHLAFISAAYNLDRAMRGERPN